MTYYHLNSTQSSICKHSIDAVVAGQFFAGIPGSIMQLGDSPVILAFVIIVLHI